jgi:hypothetical protein
MIINLAQRPAVPSRAAALSPRMLKVSARSMEFAKGGESERPKTADNTQHVVTSHNLPIFAHSIVAYTLVSRASTVVCTIDVLSQRRSLYRKLLLLATANLIKHVSSVYA